MSTTAFNWEGYIAPGIAPRAIAVIIDWIIIGIIGFFITTPIVNMLMPPPNIADYANYNDYFNAYTTWSTTSLPLQSLLTYVIISLYFIIFGAYLTDGQSIGKIIMNIKVMTVDLNGNFVSVKGNPVPLLIRSVLYIVDCCCCGCIGYIIINQSANQQRLGDSIAKTVVVRK